MYNGEFEQVISITITGKTHDECLQTTKIIKKQCEAWSFCVSYEEHKSAHKGDVLKRELMVYQTAYAGDIVIFKEAIRRICEHYTLYSENISFIDRGTEPVNELRKKQQ